MTTTYSWQPTSYDDHLQSQCVYDDQPYAAKFNPLQLPPKSQSYNDTRRDAGQLIKLRSCGDRINKLMQIRPQ